MPKITTARWIMLDTETTGLDPKKGAKVIELGWCEVKNMKIVSSGNVMIHPGTSIPGEITKLTGIADKDVAGRKSFKEETIEFIKEFKAVDFVAAYNKNFDRDMIKSEFEQMGEQIPEKIWLDPLQWARMFMHDVENHKLTTVAEKFKAGLERAHRADADAQAAAEVMIRFFEWGVDEANFPDDVEALRDMGRVGDRNMRTKYRMDVSKKKMTGTPGKTISAQDAGFAEAKFRGAEYLRLNMLEKWSRKS